MLSDFKKKHSSMRRSELLEFGVSLASTFLRWIRKSLNYIVQQFKTSTEITLNKFI